jgi:hypothetical protein
VQKQCNATTDEVNFSIVFLIAIFSTLFFLCNCVTRRVSVYFHLICEQAKQNEIVDKRRDIDIGASE